jgi:hypothetical protein
MIQVGPTGIDGWMGGRKEGTSEHRASAPPSRL